MSQQLAQVWKAIAHGDRLCKPRGTLAQRLVDVLRRGRLDARVQRLEALERLDELCQPRAVDVGIMGRVIRGLRDREGVHAREEPL